MIEISLLPVDEEAQQKKTAQKGLGFEIPKFIPRGFGIAVVVLLALFAFSYVRSSSLSKNLENRKQELDELKELSLQSELIKAKLGPPPGQTGTGPSPPGTTEAAKDSGERLRKRADIFQTRLQNRKLWWHLLKEIALCCPQEIRLTSVKESALRTGTSTQQAKKLVISGYYTTGGNAEMVFRERLRASEAIKAHYRSFTPMTQPEADRTLFSIHCTD